jgi:vacuolar protein sorting-associated protein 13A/C
MLKLSEWILEDEEEESAQQGQGEAGYFTKMQNAIINNIQVEIQNVHLRYEDNHNGIPFSLGVTLESAFARSTNEKWEFVFVKPDSKTQTLYKQVNIRNMSFYWNTSSDNIAFSNNEELGTQLREQLYTGTGKLRGEETPLKYVVSPTGVDIKLTMNKKNNASQILLDCICQSIFLCFDENQYAQLISKLEYFRKYSKMINVNLSFLKIQLNLFRELIVFISI